MPLLRSVHKAARRAVGRRGRYVLDAAVETLTGRPNLLRHVDLSVGMVRRRLMPDRLFVGWILAADEDGGGARVHALGPHAYLRSIGVNSVILRKPRPYCLTVDLHHEAVERLIGARLDVVVFEKLVGEGAATLARRLGAAGTRTVYVAGDLYGHEVVGAVDWLVAASEQLTRIAGPHQNHVTVIEPVIDAPAGLVKDYRSGPRRDRIQVVWVGYPENLHLLEPIREALRDPRLSNYELVTISRGPGVTHQWDRTRVHRQLLDCDIAVLPVGAAERYQVKPNTRMTMFKSLGIPIVASPMDSYRRTLVEGRGCYFARTTAEWVEALLALREPDCRRKIGLADREQILARYGPEAIGQKWLALFQAIAARPVSPGRR